MTFPDLLQRIASILDQAGIPYMLTGSMAAAFHGVPRATQDIDLVVEVSEENLDPLIHALMDLGLYVSHGAAREAMASDGQFNGIDPESGWKIDFIVRKGRPFSRAEFSRRILGEMEGFEVRLATREDLIIAKLEWAQKGESELQLKDVRTLLEKGRHDLDLEYVERWVRELALDAPWESVRRVLGSEPA